VFTKIWDPGDIFFSTSAFVRAEFFFLNRPFEWKPPAILIRSTCEFFFLHLIFSGRSRGCHKKFFLLPPLPTLVEFKSLLGRHLFFPLEVSNQHIFSRPALASLLFRAFFLILLLNSVKTVFFYPGLRNLFQVSQLPDPLVFLPGGNLAPPCSHFFSLDLMV